MTVEYKVKKVEKWDIMYMYMQLNIYNPTRRLGELRRVKAWALNNNTASEVLRELTGASQSHQSCLLINWFKLSSIFVPKNHIMSLASQNTYITSAVLHFDRIRVS